MPMNWPRLRGIIGVAQILYSIDIFTAIFFPFSNKGISVWTIQNCKKIGVFCWSKSGMKYFEG